MSNLISSKSEFNKIKSSSKIPVFVKFFATWCGPCKMMIPIFERLEKDFQNQAKFLEIDVDNCDGIANDYSVFSVPTFIIFKDGEEFERISGATTYEQLENLIKNSTAVV